MGKALMQLATQTFGSLSYAEEAVIRSATLGRVAECDGPPHRRSLIPSRQSTIDREVRSEFIRWMCITSEARALVDPFGIQICNAIVRGAKLDLSSVALPYPLVFSECTLALKLILSNAEIAFLSLEGSFVQAVEAFVLRVRGDVYLRHGFLTDCDVILEGATVGGDLDLSTAHISGCSTGPASSRGGMSFDARGVTVNGDVLLRRGCFINGGTSVEGAKISGDLDCRDATLIASEYSVDASSNLALDIQRAQIDGDVILDRASTIGEVRLIGAHIKSNVTLSGSTLRAWRSGPDDAADPAKALNGDGARIDGQVLIAGNARIHGALSLVSAQIGTQLECNEAEFVGVVMINSATISGELFWRNIRSPDRMKLNLVNTTVKAFVNEVLSWPAPGQLEIEGFTYGRMSSGKGPRPDWLHWIALRPRYRTHYSQPYRQLAKFLRESGSDDAARRVLYTMECHRLDTDRRTAPTLFHRLSVDVVSIPRRIAGHGYYPMRAVVWLIVLFVLGGVLFESAFNRGAVVPTDSAAFRAFSETHALPDGYPSFHPYAYSLESSFPVLKLGQIDRWQPTPDANALWYAHWLQVLMGWFITAIFVAAVTGIIKKEP